MNKRRLLDESEKTGSWKKEDEFLIKEKEIEEL